MVGARYTPLSYVINDTERPRITRSTPLFEEERIDTADIEFLRKNTTHHGPQYQEDNSKVWMLLKKSLLGNQPYHHIDEFGREMMGEEPGLPSRHTMKVRTSSIEPPRSA